MMRVRLKYVSFILDIFNKRNLIVTSWKQTFVLKDIVIYLVKILLIIITYTKRIILLKYLKI